MNSTTIETIHAYIRWAFMAAVTATLLAMTFEQARRGLPGLAIASAYALTAGFGLEFLRAAHPVRPRGENAS
ncbi:MAG TPA: hypothetical protein VHF88_06220 [Thermoleophilaceae bacterium]|nr:hypothetical protein [Thermoleophilaceae bacterium]